MGYCYIPSNFVLSFPLKQSVHQQFQKNGHGNMTITPMCGSSPYCWQNVRSTKFSRMHLYALRLWFPLTGTKGPKHIPAWQHFSAENKVYKETVCQGWIGKTLVACSKPWPHTLSILLGWTETQTAHQASWPPPPLSFTDFIQYFSGEHLCEQFYFESQQSKINNCCQVKQIPI